MPFFVRPIARQLCAKVQAKLIDPKLVAFKARMVARPAYLRALDKGGPVVMS